jgi:glyoxalase family protein
MPRAIPGLHHVTAISGPPQANLDFYAGPLRQRLVKRTVNFDDPYTYHLYYGDRTGSPGSILTFFPFVDAGPGRAGLGMASSVAYAVPPGGLDAWMFRFADDAVDFDGPTDRFGERMIALTDPDGLRVELIETSQIASNSGPEPQVEATLEAEVMTDGFHSVTLWLDDPGPTARVLTDLFGYQEAGHEALPGGERLRLRTSGHARGSIIDLLRSDAPWLGRQGAGTIHHVAFRAETDDAQHEWRERLLEARLQVTPVIDRQYFHAIYFREPGGVLFEIATDPPGFAVDEAPDDLGANLKLPPQYEAQRASIERRLPPIRVPV